MRIRFLAGVALWITVFASPAAAQAARDTISDFKALHSVLDLGVKFSEYERPLIEAKIRFDRYAERRPASTNEGRVRDALVSAMGYHRLARTAWSDKIEERNGVRLRLFVTLKDDTCPRIRPLLTDIERNWPEMDPTFWVGPPWSDQLLQTLWPVRPARVELEDGPKGWTFRPGPALVT